MAAPVEPDTGFGLPHRPEGWTVDDVLALPEDQTTGQRVELVDGAVLVSPWPRLEHQRLVRRLCGQLDSAAPPDLEVFPGANLVLGNLGNRLLVPDLVVSNVPGFRGVSLNEMQVVLVVEIESPSTRVADRILKRALYAEALVPYYLLVDPIEPVAVATVFALSGDAYEPIAKSEGGYLELTRPFGARLMLGG